VNTVEIATMPTDSPDAKVWKTRHELLVDRPSEAAFKHCGEGLTQLSQDILAIHGVESVQLFPYTLVVTKASLFSWNEIDGKVERALKHNVLSIANLVDSVLV